MISSRSASESSSSETSSYPSYNFIDDDITNDSTNEDSTFRRSSFFCISKYVKRHSADQIQNITTPLLTKRKSENHTVETNNYLELIANELIDSSKFLQLGVNSNPLEQIRLVLAFIVSSMYVDGTGILTKWENNQISQSLKKQTEDVTVYVKKQDRQISYSLNSFTLDFDVEAVSLIQVSSITTLNTLQAQKISKMTIRFKTPSPSGYRTYDCSQPEMRITGEINSKRILGYTGTYMVSCEDTKLYSDVNFQYDLSSTVGLVGGSIQNVFYLNDVKKVYLNDFIEVEVYKRYSLDDTEIIIPLDNAQSKWLDKIKFNKFMNLKMCEKISRTLKRKNQKYLKNKNIKLKIYHRSKKYHEDNIYNYEILLS